jgi:hypothetical protein
VEVEFTLDDGTKTRVPWDGRGDTMRLSITTSRSLASVEVDPERRVLVDDDYVNNKRVCSARASRRSSRLLELLTYVGELLAQGVGP